jgi:hypothetical protein
MPELSAALIMVGLPEVIPSVDSRALVEEAFTEAEDFMAVEVTDSSGCITQRQPMTWREKS